MNLLLIAPGCQDASGKSKDAWSAASITTRLSTSVDRLAMLTSVTQPLAEASAVHNSCHQSSVGPADVADSCVHMQAYAMTEASHQMSSNPLPVNGQRKPGSVGKAQGSIAIAILSLNSNILDKANAIGEVAVRGPSVMSGYLNRKEATEEAFQGQSQPDSRQTELTAATKKRTFADGHL